MVPVNGGRSLEIRRPPVAVVGLGVALWVVSCTDADDDDTGGNAGTSMSGAGTGGGAGMSSNAGGMSKAGSSTSGAGRGNAGSSSSTGGSGGRGGTGMGGASASGGSAGTVTTGGSSGSGSAGKGGSAGTTGGNASSGGSSGMSGESATGGTTSVGGNGPMPGFECGNETCTQGQLCITCILENQQQARRCVPNEDDDPEGYEEATSDCASVREDVVECDGPEDCPEAQYCVYSNENSGLAHCSSEPIVGPTVSCCFVCDALPICTMCWTEDDCPETYICVPAIGSPSGAGGCRLAE